jgi:hypothetical protein
MIYRTRVEDLAELERRHCGGRLTACSRGFDKLGLCEGSWYRNDSISLKRVWPVSSFQMFVEQSVPAF